MSDHEELPICENCREEIGWIGREGSDELHDTCRERIIAAYCARPGLRFN